ncbi:MAG: PEP-CTERM sorting domain-containing protein [Pseudomonadota bacterium]
MFRRWIFVFCLGVSVCFGQQGAFAGVINGDFSDGLTGWITGGITTSDTTPDVVATWGDVEVTTDEEVFLRDGTTSGNGVPYYSYLYQGVILSSGWYTLEFDFKQPTFSDPKDFTFPDSFYASVFFAGELSSFDLFNMQYGDDILPLIAFENGEVIFDNDGKTNTDPNLKGTGWIHYGITFQNNYAFVIPTFEISDYDNDPGSSVVFLDNISITEATAPIPEPGTFLLLCAGLVFLTVMRGRHKMNLPA